MHALPAAPAPPPRRQVLVGTAIAGVATLMLIGGMLAVWILLRERAHRRRGHVVARRRRRSPRSRQRHAHRRVDAVRVRPVGRLRRPAAATAPTPAWPSASSADQRWRSSTPRRTSTSRSTCRSPRPATPGCSTRSPAWCWRCSSSASCSPAIAAFRFLGGRTDDREIVAAHALYWYVLAAVFSAVWLIVYVTK